MQLCKWQEKEYQDQHNFIDFSGFEGLQLE